MAHVWRCTDPYFAVCLLKSYEPVRVWQRADDTYWYSFENDATAAMEQEYEHPEMPGIRLDDRSPDKGWPYPVVGVSLWGWNYAESRWDLLKKRMARKDEFDGPIKAEYRTA